MTKSKETQAQQTKEVETKLVDFMPKWAKEEKCFKDAIVRDVVTKKTLDGGWPREKPTDQWAYENWLSKVVN
jgi:hypothetical protein